MRVFVLMAGIVAGVSLLAGCKAEHLDRPAAGAFSLEFTGGLPGVFDVGVYGVAGSPKLDRNGRPDLAYWALAGRHPQHPQTKMIVAGFRASNSRKGNMAALSMPRVTDAATIEIDEHCAAAGCARFYVLIGVHPARPSEEADGTCVLSTGTVEVVAVQGTRYQGRFSGEGRCSSTGGTAHPFALQQGEFDVFLSEDYEAGVDFPF